MDEIDYSKLKSIADEPHWNEFVQNVGGQLVAPLIKREGVKNADYMFHDAKVIAELKVLETEFAQTAGIRAKLESLANAHPGVSPYDLSLREELYRILRVPLTRIITKANRQIKETKQELQLTDWRGILICVNDNFRGFPPGLVTGMLGRILGGTCYRGVDALIYQTNHYVELPDNPYACLLWAPMYSESASDDLVRFVNDLGREWRRYAEIVDGPFEFNSEQESLDWTSTSVATGVRRNRRYIDRDA
jgi:hypothetical protein